MSSSCTPPSNEIWGKHVGRNDASLAASRAQIRTKMAEIPSQPFPLGGYHSSVDSASRRNGRWGSEPHEHAGSFRHGHVFRRMLAFGDKGIMV